MSTVKPDCQKARDALLLLDFYVNCSYGYEENECAAARKDLLEFIRIVEQASQ
jgi:hypothetical protein